MKPILTLALAVTMLATGCTIANPTVGQLETMKHWAAEQNYTSIAGEPVACEPAQQGCAQLRWIKADGCRRIAENEAVGPRRVHLDCAIENDEAALMALSQAADPMVQRDQVELALLDSLQRRRDAAANNAEADRYNQALAERASAAQRGPNARPAGFYYGADALLNAVLRGPVQGGCPEIGRAAQMLRDAKADGTGFATAANGLNRAIANARTARGCA